MNSSRFSHTPKKIIYLLVGFGLLDLILLVLFLLTFQPTVEYYLRLNSEPSPQVKEILKAINTRLSEEEARKITVQGKVLAKEQPYLEIGDCIPRPFILKTIYNSTLTIHNASDQSHAINLGEQTIMVEPGKSRKVIVDFAHRVPSVYPFGCDNSSGPVGGLYITTN